jgi:hypothetical protein
MKLHVIMLMRNESHLMNNKITQFQFSILIKRKIFKLIFELEIKESI